MRSIPVAPAGRAPSDLWQPLGLSAVFFLGHPFIFRRGSDAGTGQRSGPHKAVRSFSRRRLIVLLVPCFGWSAVATAWSEGSLKAGSAGQRPGRWRTCAPANQTTYPMVPRACVCPAPASRAVHRFHCIVLVPPEPFFVTELSWLRDGLAHFDTVRSSCSWSSSFLFFLWGKTPLQGCRDTINAGMRGATPSPKRWQPFLASNGEFFTPLITSCLMK